MYKNFLQQPLGQLNISNVSQYHPPAAGIINSDLFLMDIQPKTIITCIIRV